MTHDPSHAVPVRAKEVLEHFLHNPKVTQDLEDVARWRMPREMADLTFQNVERALAWLVEKQFLVRETGPGPVARFRLNPDREREAREFVATPLWQLYRQADKDPLMALARTWINATLLRWLKESPAGVGDQPGLTRSRDSIESLLIRGYGRSGEGVEAARREAGDATRALLEAMAESPEPVALLCRCLRLTVYEIQTVLRRN